MNVTCYSGATIVIDVVSLFKSIQLFRAFKVVATYHLILFDDTSEIYIYK